MCNIASINPQYINSPRNMVVPMVIENRKMWYYQLDNY